MINIETVCTYDLMLTLSPPLLSSPLRFHLCSIVNFHAIFVVDLSKPNSDIPAVFVRYAQFLKLYVLFFPLFYTFRFVFSGQPPSY